MSPRAEPASRHRDALLRTLEEKVCQLEQANRALMDDIAHRQQADIETTRVLAEAERVRASLLSILEDQRAAEASLKASETRLRTIIEAEPECVKVISPDGLVLDMNAAGLAMMEAESLAQLVGQSVLNVVTPPYRQGFGDLHKLVIQGGSGVLEYEIVGLKGTRRWLDTHAVPLRDGDGQVTALLGITRDITEQKRSEEALRASEAHLRLVTDHAPVLIAHFDHNRLYKFVNQPYAARCGMAVADILGKHPKQVLGRANYAQAGPHMDTVLGGQPVEYDLLLPEGHTHHVSYAPERDASGRVVGFIAAAIDVTEGRRAEEERARLSAAVEQAGESVMIRNLDGTIVFVNPAFEQLTGYTRAEALGHDVRHLNIDQHEAAFLEEVRQSIARGEMWSGRLVGRRKDGSSYTAEVIISPVRDAAGVVTNYVELARDVTHEEQLEEDLRSLNADLEQRVTQRTAELHAVNQELEAFSYSVSHDLRAPLRAIDGFSKVLLEDYSGQLDATGQRYLERVRGGTQRMGNLITDLLSLSRVTRSTMRWEDVDLSALAHAIAAELQESLPARAVTFVIADAVVTRGDAGLLRVVMENLLGNAWKYTSKHPTARIEFGQLPDGRVPSAEMTEEGRAPLGTPTADVVYFVRDDGAGFDMAYSGKLFGVFQRLHSAAEFEGTGIGLATIARIVHRHGGRIWAESAVDQGATFHFTLGTE